MYVVNPTVQNFPVQQEQYFFVVNGVDGHGLLVDRELKEFLHCFAQPIAPEQVTTDDRSRAAFELLTQQHFIVRAGMSLGDLVRKALMTRGKALHFRELGNDDRGANHRGPKRRPGFERDDVQALDVVILGGCVAGFIASGFTTAAEELGYSPRITIGAPHDIGIIGEKHPHIVVFGASMYTVTSPLWDGGSFVSDET